MKRSAKRLAMRPVGRAVERFANESLKQMPSDPVQPRPGPSRPSPSRPKPDLPITIERNFQNGNTSFPTSAFRCARAICWACDEWTTGEACENCGAPEWNETVCGWFDGPGVYVVQSDSGLAKIGMSAKSASGRAQEICRMAGPGCRVLCCLPNAGADVERWLHLAFSLTKDRSWAERLERLPHPTEWFWPTPALRALVAGEAFFADIAPEVSA